MKKFINFTVLLVAVAVAAVCVSCSKPAKTIENLKAAITGESNASATYKAFSAKAAQDGFINISKMFAAASEAEAIHVKNHNEVLKKLGEKEFTATLSAPVVRATAINTQAAIEGETHEFTFMYPGFITEAKAENCAAAIKSFTWACDAEKVHAMLYSQALAVVTATESDGTVAKVWYTCPKCGDLFNTIQGVDACPFCGTKSTSFLKF